MEFTKWSLYIYFQHDLFLNVANIALICSKILMHYIIACKFLRFIVPNESNQQHIVL